MQLAPKVLEQSAHIAGNGIVEGIVIGIVYTNDRSSSCKNFKSLMQMMKCIPSDPMEMPAESSRIHGDLG